MDAERAVLKAVARRKLMAAVVKDDAAWQALYDKLRDAYTRAFDAQAQAALANALERVRMVPEGADSAEFEAVIMPALEKELGPDALQAVLRGPVLNLSEALFRVGVAEVGKAVGVDILFGRPDLDALDIVGRANLYWVGNSWNTLVDGLFRGALQDYFDKGMTRAQLTERFAKDFAGLTERGITYYELLADHTATRTREMGRVTGYERAAIEYIQVRAHLDERTTQFCRHMHGRVIAVKRLSEQRAEYLNAVSTRNMEAAKNAWVMHGQADDFSRVKTSELPKGTANPPYHFRCRTITVAYFEPAGQSSPGDGGGTGPARWLVDAYNRESLTHQATEALIERCKAAEWGTHLIDGKAPLRRHYERHGKMFGSMDEYNQFAIDLIRRANRDVYLAVRRGRLKALFVQERSRATAYIATVDVADNALETLHIRDTKRLSALADDVPAIKQPGRGIQKWLGKWFGRRG